MSAGTAAAQRRIAALAAVTPVHRAFHWLHLHQPQVREWLLQMVRIPAPPFAEEERALWFLDRFRELGMTGVHLDGEGNAVGEICPARDVGSGPVLLVSAHLDTVFPAGTACDPIEDGPRILAPGACDNGAGLSALLALAAALRFAEVTPPLPLLFAANVGEEGEGDLRGMRALFRESAVGPRIGAAIVLEGAGTATAVTRALGSVRLRVTISGPGGHSWSDAEAAHPVFTMSRALVALQDLPLPTEPRTTLNAGVIAGGTSINSIPSSATVLLDLRSASPEQLRSTHGEIRRVLQETVATANRGRPVAESLEMLVEVIGERPASALPDDAALLGTLRAVDRHLSIRTELRIGSTDANLPLSLGVPALALGTGGVGGGIHTTGEWYDPTGRETALRRVLLTLLDSAAVLAEGAGS